MEKSGLINTLKNEKGVAIIMALMTMIIVGSLGAAFAILSSTEPIIANNKLLKAQSFYIADGGIEKAIGILNAAPTPPASYVETGVSLGAGTLDLNVTSTGIPGERIVTSTGYIPNVSIKKSTTRISATLIKLGDLPPLNPPGALNVNGDVDLGGNSSVDGGASKLGVYATGDFTRSGSAWTDDFVEFQTTPPPMFTADELNILKSIAKSNGTYYSQGAGTTGTLMFNPVPDGIVFVDTRSGNPYDLSNSSDFASVKITGTASPKSKGWLIVLGDIDMDGNISYDGLVYAVNDIKYRGTGAGTGVRGAVIGLNAADVGGSDSLFLGNASISYDQDALSSGGDAIPPVFLIKPGTWREVSF